MSSIQVKVGDLFESGAQTLVNTVNTVGVMGKGIALAFKKRFPEMFEDYAKRCEAGEIELGRPYVYKSLVGPWVLNFPTKGHWRSVSKLSDIVAGLEYLESHYRAWGIESLAVPPLGCGNGQLDWDVVGPTLYRHLSRLEIQVQMYAPLGTPPDQIELGFLEDGGSTDVDRRAEVAKIDPAAVALVGIVSRINRERYHTPIGRTMFQKIAYFATERGLPTGLKYQRGSYGPFASDLKRLTAQLMNNGLLREERLGRMFVVSTGPTYRDARERCKPQLRAWTPIVEQVADLFLRLQRTNDAELAATVHFAAQELTEKRNGAGAPTEREVMSEVKAWKAKRRPALDDEELATTIRYMTVLGWTKLEPSADLKFTEDQVFA